MAEIPIFCNGRTVGRVNGRTFCKTITGSIHMLRHPAAIAFDRATLRDARAAGALAVAVTDRESGRTYRATITEIEDDGFPVRRGYGDQVALPIGRFEVDGLKPAPLAGATNGERKAAQLALFGGAL